MPANLNPEYFEAEKKYKEARSIEEKIAALSLMLSVIPKHKGTDHLCGDIKRRIAGLKQEGEKKSKGGPKRAASPYTIPRAGAGQVVLLGPPNSGKSSIVGAMTKASVKIAEYPFATGVPVPGMVLFEEIRIQLIDTPPIMKGAFDPELGNLLQRADLAVIVLSTSDSDVLDQYELVLDELKQKSVVPVKDTEGDYEIEVVGGAIKTIIAVTGMDQDGGEVLELLQEIIDGRFSVFPISCETGAGIDAFKWGVWEQLRMIRVFSKQPGKKAETTEPFYLSIGGTVIDFANKIHKDLAPNLKYARVWGQNVHDGQSVQRDHALSDGDIVELHS